MYYKLGQVLQIRAIITNWGITYATKEHSVTDEEILSSLVSNVNDGRNQYTTKLANNRRVRRSNYRHSKNYTL